MVTWRRMLGGSWHKRGLVSFQDLGEELWRWRWGLGGVSPSSWDTHRLSPSICCGTNGPGSWGVTPTSPPLEASSVSRVGLPVLLTLHSPSCLSVSYSKVLPWLPEITLIPAVWRGSQVLQIHLGKEKPFNLISASELFMFPIKKVLFYTCCIF